MAKGVKGFKKGESGNPNGKPAGTKNEKTIAWENLGEFITDTGANRVKEILTNCDESDFMDYYTSLLEYFKPKQQRIENNINVQDNILEIKRTIFTKDPNSES